MPLVCRICRATRPAPVTDHATSAGTPDFVPPTDTCTEPGCGGQMEIKEDPPRDEGDKPPESWKAGFNGA